MRVLVVANEGDDDAGLVGEALRTGGADLVVAHREDWASWPDADGFDAVVLLGSEWSVYWPTVAEPLVAEASLVRVADRTGRPVLAICFGSQVAAHALGGAVAPSGRLELGWVEVVRTPAGLVTSPDGLAALPDGPWFQWHRDVVTLPPGASLLAHNDIGPQAWRLRRTLAVQFHPEVTPAVVRRWCSGGADDLIEADADATALIEETAARQPDAARRAARMARWCLPA